jgi:hypothetical protein
MSILLKISANAAATGLDTESQINLLKVAARWLEAQPSCAGM